MKTPDWFYQLEMPDRLRDRLLAQFTPHRDGWVRWHNGATVFVCGKKTPPDDVGGRWLKKLEELKASAKGELPRPQPSTSTVKIVVGLFIARQRRRVETGRPEPLSQFTLQDYIATLLEFARIVGPDRLVDDLTPADFTKYVQNFDERAASTLARKMAYIQAMFAWASHGRSRVCELPDYGPDFIKPSAQTLRDERISAVKSYTPEEIQALWGKANDQEKLWIGLGINGAMDNSDLANLTRDVINLEEGTIDYRRRKRGKVRRIIPLRPEVLKMLKAYQRPAPVRPEDADLVFLTPTGHKLVRMVPSPKDPSISSPIDYVSFRWSKLLQRAGLRPKAKRKRVEKPDGSKRVKLIWGGGSDRRGYRGLRTTFANHVAPGYGDERKIIMGHAHGETFLDDYLEKIGTTRLRELVDSVWSSIFKGSPHKGRGPKKKRKSASRDSEQHPTG